jgi:hypothetical protein
MGRRKRFSNKLYEKYDQLAKIAFKEWVQSKADVDVTYDPYGKYGIDIAVKYPSGTVILFDVEVRPRWTDGEFPYETIHLPERKKKFTNYPHHVFFIAFRQDYKAFVVIDGMDLENKVVVPNRFVGSGESFFDVDINNCKQVFI